MLRPQCCDGIIGTCRNVLNTPAGPLALPHLLSPTAGPSLLFPLTTMPSSTENSGSSARKSRQVAQQLAPIARPLAGQPAATQLATKTQQKQWRQIFLGDMEASSGTWASLLTSPEESAPAALLQHIHRTIASHPSLPPPTRESDYVSWVLTVATGNGDSAARTAPGIVIQAIGIRRRNASHRRQGWRRLAASVHLYKSPQQLAAFSHTLAVLWVDALPSKSPYPPVGAWIAELQRTFRSWDRYFDNAPRPDKRKPRQPVHLLDEKRIRLTVPAELSCLLMDRASGDLFCAVIHNFCPDPAILGWARRSITQAVSERKSSRVRSALAESAALY